MRRPADCCRARPAWRCHRPALWMVTYSRKELSSPISLRVTPPFHSSPTGLEADGGEGNICSAVRSFGVAIDDDVRNVICSHPEFDLGAG